jgi:hypothetical protein
MRPLHWVALGAFLTSLSALVTTLPTWAAATTPPFVGSVLGMLGAFAVALLSGPPMLGSNLEATSQALHLNAKEGT